MHKLNGIFLVKPNYDIPELNLNYISIDNIGDFDTRYNCIIVKTLNPDYYLLFGYLNLIITERGSILSHLSIVGREHGVPIFLSEDITSNISKTGKLTIKENNLLINNKVH